MAADILIYDSNIVPVGEDQVQHIEVARDLAGSFNHEFGDTFVLPKEKILDSSARVPGIDGQKMSKSYGNTLAVFEEPKALRKQIMRIVDRLADSGPAQAAGGRSFVRACIRCLRRPWAKREELAATYRRGGFGYGDVKKALADLAVDYFAAARQRREELVARPEQVREILGDGRCHRPQESGRSAAARSRKGLQAFEIAAAIIARPAMPRPHSANLIKRAGLPSISAVARPFTGSP